MKEYLEKFKQTFLDPKTIMSSEMLTQLDNELFVSPCNENLVEKLLSTTKANQNHLCRIGGDVFHDVEFFQPFHELNASTIFGQIDHCTLKGGRHLLKSILQHPTYDAYVLNKRKDILQKLEAFMTPEVRDDFETLRKLEKDILWVFDDIDQNLKDLYDMVLFRFCMFRPLNRFPTALTSFNLYRILVSPLIGILSPIVYFVIPYLILAIRFKMRVPFKVYIKILFETLMTSDTLLLGGGNYRTMRIISYVFSMVFYFQGILNSVEISKTLHKVSKHLVEKTNDVVQFLQTAHKLNHMMWNSDIPLVFLPSDALRPEEEEDMYMQTLEQVNYSWMTNFGKQIHTYITFNKPVIQSILTKVYSLDSLFSILHFKDRYKASYAQVVELAEKPKLQVQGIFHPCIDTARVVKNDVTLSDKNMIITGPNAGGKSTFIKSVIINVLLNQTITITNADAVEYTPFYDLHSQINIPDSKGYESLFEAEMYRCKQKLDLLKAYQPDANTPKKFALYVMDEIFNSTNPVEGIAGAYAIAKKISEYSHCLLLFTTHYVYLTKLQKTEKFHNYNMNIRRDEEGNMHYPYKLQPGLSRQYIALELLKKNGFDEEIIEEALNIKSKLTKERV